MKILIIPIFIFFLSCSENPTEIDNLSSFSIYLLADSNLTTQQAVNMGITNLELKDSPWITEEDINFYDFSTHCIYLNYDKSNYFKGYDGMFFQFDPDLMDRPFVLIADNLRCYIGGFYSLLHSTLISVPHFTEIDIGFYPSDVLHLSPGFTQETDKRENINFQQVLENLNKYSSGLDCELKNVRIVDNSDTATVEYTFSLNNNDKDDLYVLDPDIMSSSLFHYFTNGVTLRSELNQTLIQSTYKNLESPNPYYNWDFSWFTLIRSGSSITRTIQLRGYPNIPEGKYICSFTFSNPHQIEKEDRNRELGRIWIGIISSDFISAEL